MKNFRLLCCCITAAILASCEKPVLDGSTVESGNVTITFEPTNRDLTRGTAVTAFTKLNVQLFDADGEKVFEKVKTQFSTDENFGQMSLTLPAGEYTVVAVGHSSAKSATIKSPELVQFTASEGQKLTDTFCYEGVVTVGEQPEQHALTMSRVAAMVRFQFTDEEIPAALTHIKFDYTGGSANFNPTTSEGTTKSTQSETRPVSANDTYQVFTFPYMATTGTLKVTISALTSGGEVIKKKTLEQVPVTRNRITTYTGTLFAEGDGTITQTAFGFTIDTEWAGEDHYTF